MIALLKFLLTGQWPCKHKWVLVPKIHQTDSIDGEFFRSPNKYELACEHCGKMKVMRMK